MPRFSLGLLIAPALSSQNHGDQVRIDHAGTYRTKKSVGSRLPRGSPEKSAPLGQGDSESCALGCRRAYGARGREPELAEPGRRWWRGEYCLWLSVCLSQ